MRLRSGKTLAEMTRPVLKNPHSQNNALNVEQQPNESTFDNARTLTTIGVIAHVIRQM